ncbi:MAG: tRNA pseudouridine(13) synthase TruD [Proteobacteria bacterium]|nr:tRNA pseudouridine(13) synthase TruD [Pseudomonadota bacterium]
MALLSFAETPRLCADLAGTGGAPIDPEDFCVEELPAYAAAGSGDHVFVWLEKRELTTWRAIELISAALGLDPAQAGYAGLKDRHAVTRQWISFSGADPAALLALRLPGLAVLQAERHAHKLRTGHLRGNRFQIVLRGVGDEAALRAECVLARLARLGLPNYYGPQRFGASGDNAELAREALQQGRRPHRDKRRRRLLISALQSQLFNEVLAARLRDGLLHRVLDGDVLQRSGGRATFISDDAVADQARLDAAELTTTGPICGPRMARGPAGSAGRRWEDGVLAPHGVEPEDFALWGRLARGGRRPLTVEVGEPTAELIAAGALRLGFTLPAGSYATVLLREVAQP